MKNQLCVPFFCLLFIALAFTGYSQEKTPTQNNKLVQPPYLKAGDTIAIVAPSGILENREAAIEKAVQLANSWGLHVVLGNHIYAQAHHFAGTDAQRAADFQKALDNPNIKAIWCARGGYGSVRILDRLDFTAFKKHPKWIIGYSDITAFHSHLHTLGFETLQAIMPTSLEEAPEDVAASIASFKKALFGEHLSYTIASNPMNRTGDVRGQIVGGNLTLLLTMLGSKSQISTDGAILFFEDIGEYKYHIDRMLQSLKRAGYFEHCKGIIVGEMTKLRKNTTPWGQSIEELVLNVVSDYSFPVLFDFPAGHGTNNEALILGRTIHLKVGEKESSVVFEK